MNQTRRAILLGLAAAVLAGAVASAQELPPPRFVTPNPELKIQAVSRIQSVTVFADRATVVRTAAIRPILGPQSVVFAGLPTTIIGGSLRASGRGAAEVKILGLETANEYLESPLLPEARKVQTELDALLYEIGKTKNDLAVLGVQESFLMSLPASQSALNAASVAQGKADPLGWEKTLEFLGGKLATVKAGQLDRQKTLKEQETKAEALRKRIEELKPGRPAEARKVTVLIEAKTQGDFTLDLSYTVANARWTPVYVVRALPDSGEAELSLSAVIQQRSGESWEGVRMALSTSSPALESRPRDLSPWLLDIYVPRMSKGSSRDEGSREMMKMAEMPAAASMPAPAPPPREAEIETADVAETGLHVNFEIKRAVDVPSDGAPHKFPIDSPTVKVKYDYAAVPQNRETAYLRGTLTNTLAYPLLSGSADLFIGQDFVGAMTLPATAAGEEAKFFFGEDGQIKIKFEQVKREKSGGGLLSKAEKLHFIYRLTVQNLRKTPVSVDLADRLPISQNSKIEVKDVVLTPAPAKRDEKGMLSWTVLLAPQEKKEILIEYTIEYPRDATISGL
ncbi:MAG: mucoidy inhibitor MuiA family protein [Candidatus Aminicenantes bacterium]|nr:mucoidy inhibitor MuiA family protein [Candidatus Aminicenantes bacterium]